MDRDARWGDEIWIAPTHTKREWDMLRVRAGLFRTLTCAIAIVSVVGLNAMRTNAALCFTPGDLALDHLSLSHNRAPLSSKLRDALDTLMQFRHGDTVQLWYSNTFASVLLVVYDRQGCLVTIKDVDLPDLQTLIGAGRP